MPTRASINTPRSSSTPPGVRKRAPRRDNDTRDNILNAAMKIFATGGLGGGRVQAISRRAGSNDRMIYYYFGSKDGLFTEVVKTVYGRRMQAERALKFDCLTPQEALVAIVQAALDHYAANPEMLKIFNTENLHEGRHIANAKRLTIVRSPLMLQLERSYREGVRTGVFRSGLDPQHLYVAILALSYFFLSNGYTLSAFLGLDTSKNGLKAWRGFVADFVLNAVKA